MQRSFLFFAFIGVTLTATAGAQTATAVKGPTITAGTPKECVKGASDWQTKEWSAIPAATRTTALNTAMLAEARRIAKDCGAKLSLDKLPNRELVDLVGYYTFVGDTAAARRTLARAVSATDLSVRDRATMLQAAVQSEITAASGYFGVIEGAERYMDQLAALPDEVNDIKIAAHQRMLGNYEYLDVASGLQKHSTALIALGKRTNNTNILVGAYQSLARASADMLQPAAALKILDDAEKELGASAARSFGGFRNRYALLGTRATPVTGQWWVNTDTPPASMQPGNGKVTLVEFTAHWCAPCRNSYPGLTELSKHFQGKPFEGVMVTNLYGYLGAQRPLTPEQEVAADRIYYSTEHKVPFPVAINASLSSAARSAGQENLDAAYRVGGIPQIMIVDKKGMIRQIVTGWDQGNTERFKKYIEALLAEK